MVERAARALATTGLNATITADEYWAQVLTAGTREHYRSQACLALSAALAGRPVVDSDELAAKDQRISELENLLHHTRLRIDRDLTRHDREWAWQIVADVRDAAERSPRDASTDDILDALAGGGVLRLAAESVSQNGGDQ
jgi:hypothetical protein